MENVHNHGKNSAQGISKEQYAKTLRSITEKKECGDSYEET